MHALNRPLWQKRLILAGKFALAGGLLTCLAVTGRLEFSQLASVAFDRRTAILALLVAGSMVLPAVRWWWLLRMQALREPIGKIVSLTWAGYIAALILPGAAGGDLARSCLILQRHRRARARAFSTVLADRFLGIHSLFCLGAISAAWLLARGESSPAVKTMAMLTLVPLAIMTFGLIALLATSSRNALFRVLPRSWRLSWDESFLLYRGSIPGLLGCFGLSLASGIMTVASFAIAGRMLGNGAPWASSFLAGPLVVAANCLPFTPGGIGVAEAVSSNLFAGLGSSTGAEIMLLVRTVIFVLSLPGILSIGRILHSSPIGEQNPGTPVSRQESGTPISRLAPVAPNPHPLRLSPIPSYNEENPS
jgi:uncharacterized membrane protein YbhN (UPF0104 family)